VYRYQHLCNHQLARPTPTSSTDVAMISRRLTPMNITPFGGTGALNALATSMGISGGGKRKRSGRRHPRKIVRRGTKKFRYQAARVHFGVGRYRKRRSMRK
jgi:hypothetical protein